MTDVTEKCRRTIERIGPCCSVSRDYPLEYEFFKELFRYHPDNKARDMVDLQIVKNIYKQLELKFINEDTTEDTISWVKCAKEMNRARRRG